MDVISILLSGFVGALLATWIGEWLRRRDRFTTAVFAIQHELGRNAEMVRFIFDPEHLGLEPHEEPVLELPGPLFETHAWREHGASAGPRIAKHDWTLWRDAMGAYMVMESYNRSYSGSFTLDQISGHTSDKMDELAEKLEFIADEFARFFPPRMSMRYFRDFVHPRMRESEPAE
jgi:hypothetical protein